MPGTGKCVHKMARLVQDRRNLQMRKRGRRSGARPKVEVAAVAKPLPSPGASPPPRVLLYICKHYKAYTNLALATFAAYNLSTRVDNLVFVLHGQFILGQTSLRQVHPASDVLLRAHSSDCKARLDLAKTDYITQNR